MSKRIRAARNARFRRIHYNPPGFRHWNNQDVHDGLGRWLYLDDEHLTHVAGNTVQCHYYWAGLHTTPENWEGIVRRTVDPLPGEKGIKARIVASFVITGRTAGSCAMMIQNNQGTLFNSNGVHTRNVDISSTSDSQFFGFAMVPSTDFDGTISLPIVHSVQRL